MHNLKEGILNREYKFEFFKKELDNILESELEYKDKEKKFSELIEMVIYDSVFLLSEIKYFFTKPETYLDIFPKVIDTFHYRIYTYGGQLFDARHSESNPKLLEFYNEVKIENPEIFKTYENFLYVFTQKYRVGIMYWFDLTSYTEFTEICEKMLKDKKINTPADIWLKEEIVHTHDSFLNIGNKLRSNF